ncbi:hypothetical protein KI688_001896 [Linnemannia hyalina]|uniref:Uncharacterized protein n=1 Tax=Linnemannia hyalina TaxID=64524 RepID=A0A9P8BU56_9FUNG|nr:hypothetical protein KI688_001896 [Linnemannia hyalina]
MNQHPSNPLVFQDSFNRDGFHDGGNSSANGGKDENSTGNSFFENEMSFNSDRFLCVNFSDDLFSSTPIFSSLPQVTEHMCFAQQEQQQLQQHTEHQVHFPSSLADSSTFAFPLEHTFTQQQQSQGHAAQVLSMPQFSTVQYVPESQQTHQDTTTLDSQQQLLHHQTPTIPSQPQQYCDSSVLNAFRQHLPSPSPSLDASTAASVAIIATATSADTHHQQNPNYYNNVLLNQTSSTQRIPMGFTQFRSPALDQFSLASPNEDSLSPATEHGYFDRTEESSSSSPFYHPLSSAYLNYSGAEYLTSSLQDFALSAGNGLFPLLTSASSSSPVSSSVMVIPFNNVLPSPTSSPTDLLTVLVPPSVISRAVRKTASQQQLSTSGHHQYHQDSFLSSPASSTCDTLVSYSPTLSNSSASPLFGSTVPALSSPLKQQFKRVAFSDGDDSDIPNEEEENKRNPKRRKRVRKAAPKPVNKPKGPRITLYCQYPGCKVTCSSHPSMVRHAEAHKWRGLYSPVRCEACQSSLSNEFSVQRHILRSAETSRCRKMRTYSIMRSENEIDSTVKFCPRRPHGKKTVPVDLAKMKAKYIEGWQGTMDDLVGQCKGKEERVVIGRCGVETVVMSHRGP